MNQAGLVGAELHLTGLDLLDRGGHIEGHRAGLGVRHQALGTEHLAQATNHLHHVRSRDQSVESGPVFFLDLLDHLLAAHEVSACIQGFLLAVARGDHGNGLGLAQTVRQNHGATDHLVGVTRVDAQTHGQIDGFVELGELDLLEQLDSLRERIRRLGDSSARLHNILANFFCHSFLVSHRFCQSRWPGHLGVCRTGNVLTPPHGTLDQAQKPWCSDGPGILPDTSTNHTQRSRRMQIGAGKSRAVAFEIALRGVS